MDEEVSSPAHTYTHTHMHAHKAGHFILNTLQDELSNIDSSVTEPHNNSAGQNSSYMAQSPSDLSKSSARERSSSSSDSSSSEDEEAATGYHMTSPITSNEWQEQIEKRRKKSGKYSANQTVRFCCCFVCLSFH